MTEPIKKAGRPRLPADKHGKRLQIYVSAKIYNALAPLAAREGKTVPSYIARLIDTAVQKGK